MSLSRLTVQIPTASIRRWILLLTRELLSVVFVHTPARAGTERRRSSTVVSEPSAARGPRQLLREEVKVSRSEQSQNIHERHLDWDFNVVN